MGSWSLASSLLDDLPDLIAFIRHARALGWLVTVQIAPQGASAAAEDPWNDV